VEVYACNQGLNQQWAFTNGNIAPMENATVILTVCV
jgi:hypothetical protein